MTSWQLHGKRAFVFGNCVVSAAIKEALTAENVTICSSCDDYMDILVTVPAKINSHYQHEIKISDEEWQDTMNTLFEETRKLTHKILPKIQARGNGRVIHVIGSHEPFTFNVEFTAWGALAAWSKSLTRAIGKDGTTINLIQAGVFKGHPNEKHVPIGRPCQASDIANLVVFLSSKYSKYINGAIIPVDGGLSRYQH